MLAARGFWLGTLVALYAAPAALANAAAQPVSKGLLPAHAGAQKPSDAMSVYLEVSLNEINKGIAPFTQRGQSIYASREVLTQLGLFLPTATTYPVNLNTVNGLSVVFNQELQTLRLIAPVAWLNLPLTEMTNRPNQGRPAQTGNGFLVNYDLYATQSFGNNSAASSNLSAFTEWRAFGAPGLLNSTFLTRQASAQGGNYGALQNGTVRLDTVFSHSFPEQAITLNVGDTLTQALSWSRSLRIAGIQIGRNFALQPYTVTSPLVSFLGSSTLPSTAELYIDGIRQFSQNLPPGPFQFNAVPSINGSGEAQVVLTDALGRPQTLNFSFYYTPQLLRAGVSDFSGALGFVRKNYGITSNDYDSRPLGSGLFRYGLTNQLTLEAQGETTAGLVNAGFGGSWNSQRAGVFSASVAGSRYEARTGSQWRLGYSYNLGSFYFGASKQHANGNYLDAAALYGSPPVQDLTLARVGFNTADFGGFGVGYVGLKNVGSPASRYATLNWFRQLGGRASLSASLNRDLVNRDQSTVFLSLTIALGNRTTASASAQRDGLGNTQFTAQATESMPSDGGLGWRVAASQASGSSSGAANGAATPTNRTAQAELNYLGRYGRASGGLYDNAATRYGYASFSGGLVLMDSQLFATQTVQNSFALVNTQGFADVPVTLENRTIGTTNGAGYLLVPQLNAYQNNKIGIDTLQLPADVRVGKVTHLATPMDRAGVTVDFDLTAIKSATVILVDAAGKPLPVGALVQVNQHNGTPAVVGFDGMVYLDTLKDHNTVNVTLPASRTAPQPRRCTAEFTLPKHGDGIPQIGPLRCSPEVTP